MGRHKKNFGECKIEGCNRPAARKRDDIYHSRCWVHKKGTNNPCMVCGWEDGAVDRHRLDSMKGYEKTNILFVCPNHHRLLHQ